jgi:hypothetical protein
VSESIDFRWSPVQILETEALYPGLIEDLGVEIWQRRLIVEQIESEKKEPEDG